MKPIDIATIYARLREAGFRDIVLTDESYVAPGRDWLEDFGRHLAKRRFAYIPNTFDCEQFARWAAHEADLALVKAGVRGSGHTFGEAHCMQDRQAHVMNICLCSDEILYALEPQTGVVTPALGHAVWTRARV